MAKRQNVVKTGLLRLQRSFFFEDFIVENQLCYIQGTDDTKK